LRTKHAAGPKGLAVCVSNRDGFIRVKQSDRFRDAAG
jgi:hypothetical protein